MSESREDRLRLALLDTFSTAEKVMLLDRIASYFDSQGMLRDDEFSDFVLDVCAERVVMVGVDSSAEGAGVIACCKRGVTLGPGAITVISDSEGDDVAAKVDRIVKEDCA